MTEVPVTAMVTVWCSGWKPIFAKQNVLTGFMKLGPGLSRM